MLHERANGFQGQKPGDAGTLVSVETPRVVSAAIVVDCAALIAAAYLTPLPWASTFVFSVAVLSMCALAGVYGTEPLRPFSHELFVVVRCALIGSGLLIVVRIALELPWTLNNPAAAAAVFVAGAIGGRIYLHRRGYRDTVMVSPDGDP